MDEKLADKGGINVAEVRFLMTGGTSVTIDRPNPAGEGTWFSNKSWAGFMQLSREIPVFKGFDLDMEKHIKFWEDLYNSSNVTSDEHIWPGKWNDELTILQKTIVIRLLRPDKVIMMIQKLISAEEEIGQYYIIPPSFDMEEIVNDSMNNTPIIIVLSPGADPMVDIMEV